ncbi:MAG: hypothetical protein KDA96_04170, partial [Planctomycetaceae bacterium]|nr:hypothetical protein [Planctomycetaceae bacterium]
VTIAEDAPTGVHWIRFVNDQGATSPVPFFVGMLPEVAEASPNDRLAEAQALPEVSAVLNGVLEKSGDVDCCSLQLTEGQTLVAVVQAHSVLQSPMDGILQLLNESGTILAQNDDAREMDPMIVYPVTRTGTYYLRVFAFPAAPNSTIRYAGGSDYVYRLTTSVQPFVHHTLPLAVRSGETPALMPVGWNLSDLTSLAVASPDAGNMAGLMWVGTDCLHEPIPVDVVDCEPQTYAENSSPLMIPACVTGQIGSGQEAVVAVDGTKGQKLRFQVIAQQRWSQLDPVLSVRAADGKVLKEVDDISKENSDCDLTLSLPADGQYQVVVRDRFRHGGEQYFFLLRIEDAKPDFEPSAAKSEVVLKPDGPAEIAVTVNRREGLAESIAFSVDGLPEGLTCTPAISEKEGDSSKTVTLKIEGSRADGFSGPIRLIGTAAESGLTRPVVTRPAGRLQPLRELWLTAVPSPDKE